MLLAIFELPPADCPSTMNNSVFSSFLEEQSASLPGRAPELRAPFLLTMSLAFFAACLALAALMTLLTMVLAIEGFSSKNCARDSVTTESTNPLTSEFPSFVFVCPSNCGDFSLRLITAVIPSLASSPSNFISDLSVFRA